MMTYRQLIEAMADRTRANARALDLPVVLVVRDGEGRVHAGGVEALLLSEVAVLRPALAACDDWADDTVVQGVDDFEVPLSVQDFAAASATDKTVVFYGLPLSPRLPG